MVKIYDLIVIGSGPGGYVAAIKASQLGMSTAIVEKESLGGVCLNWGCIPTKTLLKSAQVLNYIKNSEKYGISIDSFPKVNFEAIMQKSRDVALEMSKGVNFLMKKNKIDILSGLGKLKSKNVVSVINGDQKIDYQSKHIILATGSSAKHVPAIPVDDIRVINYRKALSLANKPKSMVIIGAGAIGVEFADFYNSMGVEVSLIEYMPNILPLEDIDVSICLEKIFNRKGISVHTNTKVDKVENLGDNCNVYVESNGKQLIINSDIVLSAIGITPNIANIGLDEVGVKVSKNKVVVDEYYRTNIGGVYAIGDITTGPSLAHTASAEGIVCVEKLVGLNPLKIDYNNIPSCIYCQPEVASVGYTEKAAIDAGYKIKVGKFPFSASGKAAATGNKDGFVKVIFDAKYGEWLGAHMVGDNVSEIISSVVIGRQLETTASEILASIHPHPTMSEALMEAVANAYGQCVNL